MKSSLSQAPCKCKEHSWNETNDLTSFWWAGWCKCFTLTTLHTHNIGANSSPMNTFLCMLSFKINKQKWVIYQELNECFSSGTLSIPYGWFKSLNLGSLNATNSVSLGETVTALKYGISNLQHCQQVPVVSENIIQVGY